MDEKFCQFYTNFYQYFDKVRFFNKKIVYFQDDVTRFWREEKEKGAIYNVYLKKVTYHTLSDVSTWLRSYYFFKIRCTEKSEKEVKSRSVSKTTSVKKNIKSLLLAMELGLQLLRKEKFQKWKEKTNWMFATTCCLGWWKGKRKNFNDTQCQICIGFCLCFVLFL